MKKLSVLVLAVMLLIQPLNAFAFDFTDQLSQSIDAAMHDEFFCGTWQLEYIILNDGTWLDAAALKEIDLYDRFSLWSHGEGIYYADTGESFIVEWSSYSAKEMVFLRGSELGNLSLKLDRTSSGNVLASTKKAANDPVFYFRKISSKPQ